MSEDMHLVKKQKSHMDSSQWVRQNNPKVHPLCTCFPRRFPWSLSMGGRLFHIWPTPTSLWIQTSSHCCLITWSHPGRRVGGTFATFICMNQWAIFKARALTFHIVRSTGEKRGAGKLVLLPILHMILVGCCNGFFWTLFGHYQLAQLTAANKNLFSLLM